mmetsp:Transcript_22870/g.35294  ORF Transcript_22870/g.35294 Transcript_22870/m.35294 type:complete len:274 (+) Transcript_22870:1062-1883(+)
MFLQGKTVKSPSREIVKLWIWSNRCFVKLLKWDRIIPMQEEEDNMEAAVVVVVMEMVVVVEDILHNNIINNREDIHPKVVVVGMVVTNNNHLHNNTTSNNLLMVNSSSSSLMVHNHPTAKLLHLMLKHLHHPISILHNNSSSSSSLINSMLPTVVEAGVLTLHSNRYLLLLQHLRGKQPLLAMDKCITTTKFRERHNGKNQLECCKTKGSLVLLARYCLLACLIGAMFLLLSSARVSVETRTNIETSASSLPACVRACVRICACRHHGFAMIK